MNGPKPETLTITLSTNAPDLQGFSSIFCLYFRFCSSSITFDEFKFQIIYPQFSQIYFSKHFFCRFNPSFSHRLFVKLWFLAKGWSQLFHQQPSASLKWLFVILNIASQYLQMIQPKDTIIQLNSIFNYSWCQY